MRPLPLVATTRDESTRSASAAADPSRSSSLPPLHREEEQNRGDDGDDQQGRRDDESPLETEKLRAGIQHLLSSAPAPSGQSQPQKQQKQKQQQQQQQQKRREASTPRRRATPRRAVVPPSATKKTPASASAEASNFSSSRPYKAQLALFSVSKPTQLPASSSALRSRAENEGMEDQAPLAATTVAAAASPQCPEAVSKEFHAAAAAATAAEAETAQAAHAAVTAASPSAPSPAARAPPPPPPPPPPLDPFAAYKAALDAMNAARTARATGAGAGDGANASASAAVVRAAAPPQPSSLHRQLQQQHMQQQHPQAAAAAAAAPPPPSPGAAFFAAPSPLRTQQQQQQQHMYMQQQQHMQQAWASPGPQPNNNGARRPLPFYPRPPPPTPQLPAGGVDDCYSEFSRQQEACDWADAVNRLAFEAEEARKKRGGAGREGGAGEGEGARSEERTRASSSASASASIDEGRLFGDGPSSLPDPALLGDPDSLPRAPFEPVKVFCTEVPVDNPVQAAPAPASAAANAAPPFPGRPPPPTHYRRFVAASYPAFLRRYLSPIAASTGGRHVYEVLREARPCHAYFDVEFARAANPGADGDALVDALVAALRAELAAVVGERAARAALVLESDSSTAAKFSRHLLLRLPGGLAFRDNAAVGRLLGEALSRDGAAARLRVAKAESSSGGGGGGGGGGGTLSSPRRLTDDQRVAPAASRPRALAWVADTAVYTRNRHFRVLLSSKGGKHVALEPTRRHAHAPGAPLDSAETTRRDLVLLSLVANVEPGTRLVDVSPAGGGGGGGRVAIAGVVFGNGGFGIGGAAAASAAAAPRLVSREATLYRSGGRAIKFEWKHHAADLRGAGAAAAGAAAGLEGGAGARGDGPPSGQSCPSGRQRPDPRLVEAALAAVPFVEALAVKRAGSTAPGAATGDAYVRSAAVIGAAGGGGGGGTQQPLQQQQQQQQQQPLPPLRSAVVAFSLLGPASHWCEFVGRRHGSNHVFFVLDFGAGTWVQKCYDPDCAAKKGGVGALPPELRLRVERE